jgi:hypothetical protein
MAPYFTREESGVWRVSGRLCHIPLARRADLGGAPPVGRPASRWPRKYDANARYGSERAACLERGRGPGPKRGRGRGPRGAVGLQDTARIAGHDSERAGRRPRAARLGTRPNAARLARTARLGTRPNAAGLARTARLGTRPNAARLARTGTPGTAAALVHLPGPCAPARRLAWATALGWACSRAPRRRAPGRSSRTGRGADRRVAARPGSP